MNEEERQIEVFEEGVWAYYQNLKSLGWSDPAEGDSNSREALFWREPSGRYGVRQIAAAWFGWCLCIQAKK